MLLSREAIAEVVEILEPDHFYKPAHAHLYDAVMSLYGAGEPVDAVTVAEELQRAGMLEEIGGPAVLLDFQATTPAISNAAHYAKIVEEHALLRRLITVSNEIAEMAYGVPEDVVKAVDDAESRMFDVAQRRVTNTTAPIRDLLPANLDRIEMLYDRGESITGLSTGYLDLDEKLAGLQPNSLYVVGARPAMGKALALDTPLATPSGWTTMGAVGVGDQVFDERGEPTTVTYKSPIFRGHDCYQVAFDDGSVIVADADHQWLTWDQPARACEPATLTTRELAGRLQAGAGPDHRIPVAAPLDCPEHELPLDPYLFGTWLGDGHTGSPRAFARGDQSGEVFELAAPGAERIPGPYLRSPAKQRLELLRGIMDAAGWMAADGTTCQLALLNEGLLADARELALSLGYRAGPVTQRPSKPGVGAGAGTGAGAGLGDGQWGFEFAPLDPVLGPGQKAAAQRPPDRPDGPDPDDPSRWRTIVAVRPTVSRPVQCITVDAPSHLYLAGREMIPTHNTAFALGMAANSAMKDRRPVLIFTLEMGQLELSQRLLCSEALVDSGKVKTGRLEEAEWNRISHAVGRLAEAPIFIDDNPHTSVMDIRAKSRRLKSREGDLGMVVVDYIQLMSGRSSAESRQVEVSEISRNLKILARELEAPVVALAQLNRGLEQRNDKRPMLSDLRESGCMPASTRILLADGSERAMGDLLASGDTPMVLAVDDQGRIGPRRLVKTFPSGSRLVHRMTLATGRTVEATGNHRFLTVDGWVPLDQLRAGDHRLAVPRVVAGSGDVVPADIVWDEIVAIEAAGEQEVFDCTVDTVHNFIANGVVAHNSLEQDADVVLFLYRDEVYDDASPDKGVAEVIVAKHRNGPTGKVRLAFRGQYTRFDNMAHTGSQGGGSGGSGEF